ncbi:Cph1 family holin [Anoxybacillus vitaminiphilus]|uniref:Cph1 family holin n=1 Tax=Paranoxybacillus vitaminiphilus TaxID=581036 RepID=A0A327YSW5_9BACL|nr:phage holin family protein [Anoxybacillus vitaminiphilus]RAK21099.1 Cph1 family holin [Anoxybacillus vitaminiphilus]
MDKQPIVLALSIIGSFTSFLLGGWDSLIIILVCLVIIDYMTGVIASALEGKLSSQVGFRGIAKKVLIFIMVAVSYLLDVVIGWDNHLLRDMTIFFYLVNEFISIVENASRTGIPIPEFLIKAIEMLKDRSK